MSMMVNPSRFAAAGAATDPYLSSVKLLMGFEGADASTTMPDESPSARGNATVVANAQIDTGDKKFGTSSLQLDGTGDYIQYGDSADWLFPAEFTVECWVQFTGAAGSGTRGFVGQFNTSLNQRSWLIGYTNGNVAGWVSTNGTAQTQISGAWTPVVGTWYKVAMDRDASNVVRVYLDGVMVNKATVSGSLFNSGQPMIIGSFNNASFEHIGRIDEVRVTKGVARYASDAGYTVPTAAFPRT